MEELGEGFIPRRCSGNNRKYTNIFVVIDNSMRSALCYCAQERILHDNRGAINSRGPSEDFSLAQEAHL